MTTTHVKMVETSPTITLTRLHCMWCVVNGLLPSDNALSNDTGNDQQRSIASNDPGAKITGSVAALTRKHEACRARKRDRCTAVGLGQRSVLRA